MIREPRLSETRRSRQGDRVADLDLEPATLIGSSSASLYALDRPVRIRTTGITFDPRIRPIVEDGHFAMRFVLELDRPRIGPPAGRSLSPPPLARPAIRPRGGALGHCPNTLRNHP